MSDLRERIGAALEEAANASPDEFAAKLGGTSDELLDIVTRATESPQDKAEVLAMLVAGKPVIAATALAGMEIGYYLAKQETEVLLDEFAQTMQEIEDL